MVILLKILLTIHRKFRSSEVQEHG